MALLLESAKRTEFGRVNEHFAEVSQESLNHTFSLIYYQHWNLLMQDLHINKRKCIKIMLYNIIHVLVPVPYVLLHYNDR